MVNTISATELKNKISEVLNEIYFTGNETIVEKHGRPVAKIVPIRKHKRSKEEIKRALDATFGSLPDFPDVTKFRRSGRRKFPALSL